MARLSAFNLKTWIDEHRDLLKPPVGNAVIWKDAEFQVMIVGGPNRRNDFHIDPGEELFYQIEGDITLRIVEDGKPRDVPIREGEILLLPAGVPHSPQRRANTVGMVVERARRAEEKDAFRWYCEGCGAVLHEATLHVSDLATQLKPILENFAGNQRLRTCARCHSTLEAPPGEPAG